MTVRQLILSLLRQYTEKLNTDVISTKESSLNKTTAITSSSTDTQYPSAKAVQTKIDSLDGSAAIASKSNDIITIKSGISEDNGIISNNSGTDIVLAKVASTGSPSDIEVQYNGNTVNLQTAITNIKSDIDTAASNATTEYYVCPNTASSIPSGFTYYNGATGTLTPSSGSATRVYLIKNGADSYEQVIRTGSSGNYAWTSLGSTGVDLSGVAKIITLNGKQYAVSGGTSLIDLGNAITAINAQTAINNPNTTYVHTVASNSINASTGSNTITLETQVKVGNITTGTSGIATSDDVKNYVDNKIIMRTWSNSN